MRIYAAIFAGLIVSCGQESGSTAPQAAPPSIPVTKEKSVDPEPSSLYVEDAADLPACDETRQGFLVYVAAEKKLQACKDTAWIDVELPSKEPDGIVEQFTCDGTGDLDLDANTGTKGLSVLVTKFSNGDYEMFCRDLYVDSQFTYSDSSSGTLAFDADSKVVKDGKVNCVGFYAAAVFDIAAKSVQWGLADGTGATVSAACKQQTP